MVFKRLFIKGINSKQVSWLISLLLACASFAVYLRFDPWPVYKYSLKLTGEITGSQTGSTFVDLNNDGIGEKIDFRDYAGFPAIEIFSLQNEFIDILRIKGQWVNTKADYLVCDIDKDGFGPLLKTAYGMG
ncbi:MAG: hypothetical protein IH594_18250 [Bacteroidales bacterium]|nr:hypothetical protein [Bacteroidales bacterium]